MKKDIIKLIKQYFAVVAIATLLLFSCQNKPKQLTSCENMPDFEQKFPQKSVWVHYGASDSTEITFSSMEEAEWKLMHVVPGWSYESFEKIILSDPSSMDYPFDSLFHNETDCELLPPVTSDDGNIRCFGIFPHSAHELPMMFAYCRINGKVCKADDPGRSEDCRYCLRPDTIYTFNTGYSKLYFVWGYNGYTGSGDSYRLCAYELDSTGLHPAFVFDEKGGYSGWEEYGQSLYTEICTNDDLYDILSENHFRALGYFDPDDTAVYIQIYKHKEKDEYDCSTLITNHYRKFVWNGKKFVCK